MATKPKAMAAREKARSAKRRSGAEARRAHAAGEACARLDGVACAWVAAVRFRLAELIDAGYAVGACADDPDGTGPNAGSLHLKTVFDVPRLNRFLGTLEGAERELNKVLLGDAAAAIPDLAGAVWAADDALADCVGIDRMPRPAALVARQ